ncbi:phosphopantetheine-binding protein, partial [Pontimicrobium sp. MEBiC06410]
YMVPNFIIEIDKIPLTPNGKTDRKQLETLSLEVESTTQYVAPETAVEQQLAILWSKLLELEEGTIGKHDNFFELGGHSLLVTRLLSKIQEQFKVKLQLSQVFNTPLLGQLSQVIATSKATIL